ncbi:MAG: hydrogenase expression/formation protein HypE [Bacteroidales bacterium]|nr:hydrogenase expression/formation protein HypE [Bacteroidales bacterium]
MKNNETILLGHGSGGRLTHDLISGLFVKYFRNELLLVQGDSALLPHLSGKLCFTTDSFVVDPIFFPGGDIGKLAIAGTVNDLAVSGAIPLFLSAAFILEEGFPLADLEKIVQSMANEAENAGVKIVTGDTKVVERGKCDKIFINTSGVGTLHTGLEGIVSAENVQPGDKIIVNGYIGDHGMAVMSARNKLQINSPVESDCACLNGLISDILQNHTTVKFMRDATRGGLGTVLAELCQHKTFGINLLEDKIPVRENVRGMCELLGFDPLFVANEGKVVMVVAAGSANLILSQLQQHPLGKDSAIIGEIVENHPGKTWLITSVGGKRIVDMPAGEQLPRIC